MRRPTALWLVLTVALGTGCSEGDTEPDPRPITQDPRRMERAGEGLYRRYCSLCHGRDGEGYAADDAPMLANQEWLRTATDDFMRAAIVDGRPGTAMSAWSQRHGGPLNDVQIAAIMAYIRSWQRSPRANVDQIEVVGDPARGRLLYLVKCARCHGPRGEGIDAPMLANENLLATASDGFIQYAIAHGRTGTRMPAFADELQPQQIDDVVAYVRSMHRGQEPELPDLPSLLTGEPDRPPNVPPLAEMDLVINPDGQPAELELRSGRFVSCAEVHRALQRRRRIVILDARATSDWLRNRIPGAIPVPFYELEGIIEGLPRDGTPMVAYCGCPHAASGRVIDALRRQGFTNTSVLDEGIDHWNLEGYATSSGEQQP